MTSALLILSLLAAEETVVTTVEPDEWPLEGRRVHYGIGARVHGGVVESVNAYRMALQSEFAFFVSFRVMGHHEWRWGVGAVAGWPDLAGGATNVSFRYHLNPRFSVGAGAFTYLGFSSMFAGLEVPLSIRLGSNRRHEVSLSFRGGAGAYNNGVTIAWYDFKALRPAWTLDAVLGYSAIF
ncbi:MAG: hypothetical protein JNK82_25130 [Myxococcaceae bacterium]|nr:hypothetical protein [Myxococcaceae bacterium]